MAWTKLSLKNSKYLHKRCRLVFSPPEATIKYVCFSILQMLNSSSSVYLTFAKKIWNLTFFYYSFVLRKIKHLVTKIKVRNKCISIALRWRFFLFVFSFFRWQKTFLFDLSHCKKSKVFCKKIDRNKGVW